MTRSRQLAAIMFTDIAGYTAMMEKDRKKTFEVLNQNRAIHNSLIEEHKGNMLKEMGDGVLASFSSVSDAVHCAIALQKACEGIADLDLSVGIHLGEVEFEENDVYGDGVNIAARIQSQSVPGSIFISDKAFDEIKNDTTFTASYLGDYKLKNVSSPQGLYAMSGQGLVVPEPELNPFRPGRSKKFKLLKIAIVLMIMFFGIFWYFFKTNSEPSNDINQSIAVLPFTNLSNDPDQEYFVVGMQDALISKLSQIGGIEVKSRTSTLKYPGNMSVPEIANEIGADVIIEGSALKSGDSIRIQVQLIDAYPEEIHLWEKSYDRKLENIFSLHNEIVLDIAEGVEVVLSPVEQDLLARSKVINQQAYEAYLLGKFHISKFTPQDVQLGFEYFDKAIEIDPDFAMAYAGISTAWSYALVIGAAPPSYIGPIMHENVSKALALDSTIAEAHYADAIVTWAYDWNWQLGEEKLRHALEINPNHAEAHIFYSHFLASQNRPDEAEIHANLALELDPLNPFLYGLNAARLVFLKEYERAEEAALQSLRMDPNNGFARGPLSVIYWVRGEFAKAYEETRASFEAVGDQEMVESLSSGFKNGGYQTAMLSGARTLEQRATRTYIKPHNIVIFYNLAKDAEKTLYWLEQCFDLRDHDMIYLQVMPYMDEVKSDARFKLIQEKLNFPK